MIIVSSRKDGANPDEESQELLLLDRAISKTGKGDRHQEGDEYIPAKDNLIERLKSDDDKEVLVLVHGYNNEQSEIYDAYLQIKALQHGNHSHIIGYVWPGGNRALEWWYAKDMADNMVDQFNELLDILKGINCTVDIMSHSLGARVCLQALKGRNKSGNKPKPVRHHFCMAAAVHFGCFNEDGILLPEVADFRKDATEYERKLMRQHLEKTEFQKAVPHHECLYVFYSKEDRVLSALYPFAEGRMALGYRGLELEKIKAHDKDIMHIIDCSEAGLSHHGYKSSKAVHNCISKMIAKSNRIQRTSLQDCAET